MGVPGNADLLLLRSAAAEGGYTISRSLRFNASDSAYCSRVPSTAGNRKTWTWAGWVKRSGLGTFQYIWGNANSSADFGLMFRFNDNDVIRIADWTGGAVWQKITTQVFRDVSAWYHLVVSYDTTNATAADRVRLYVNGSRVTDFSTNTDPTLNYDGYINNTNPHSIGRWGAYDGFYLNAYLADVHFIDGQALTPSSFTEVSATTGQLIPKAYTGSFGTNGFWLKFSDNSAATATTLGKDYSGNSNNWTPNNLSVTAGAGNDSLVDTPVSSGTDTGLGGQVTGNYCTLNPLDNNGNALANGNLELSGSGNVFRYTRSSFYVASGKWYWECLISATGGETRTGPQILRATDTLGSHTTGANRGYILVYDYLGTIYVATNPSGSFSNLYSTSGSLPAGTIVGIALDASNGKLWISVNGTWLNSGNPDTDSNPVVTGLTGPYTPGGWAYNSSDLLIYNFGQRPFSYTSNRTTFKALCDTNLPAPVVAKPSEVMDAKLYTGNGSTQTISGLGFSPDFVWLKARSAGYSHQLYDQIRGAGKLLNSNSTNAETTVTDNLTAFTSSGFTLGNDAGTNQSSATYVGWCWDAGSSTVTNTQGSITSQVRANASAGFSIVTYTGTGANATVGHGCGTAPGLILLKDRTSGAYNWQVYHSTFAGTSNSIVLNSTAGVDSGSAGVWNSTAPTSTVFSIGTSVGVNTNGNNYVAYCWSPLVGYSAMGSYVGNGSSDGPAIWLGFRPKWIMIKSSSNLEDWRIYDTARDTYNLSTAKLYPNLSAAENGASGESASTNTLDVLSNGFKLRTSNSATNASSYSYIYAAFAESPFQYARAR